MPAYGHVRAHLGQQAHAHAQCGVLQLGAALVGGGVSQAQYPAQALGGDGGVRVVGRDGRRRVDTQARRVGDATVSRFVGVGRGAAPGAQRQSHRRSHGVAVKASAVRRTGRQSAGW